MTEIIPFLKSIFPPSRQGRVVLVGGTVRDILLERECRDFDLVAALSHDNLLELGFRLVEATSGASIYFKHYPDFGKIEITRIDSMDDLANDLVRRDFTINAMAMDLSGKVIDPLGGKKDLNERLLRACSDSTFTSDPLRLFRAFRFEADGWRLTAEAEALIREKGWATEISSLPVERFSIEMLKALQGNRPERFFQRMIELNIGAGVLPELFRMPHIPAGPLQHHPEGDLFTHSIQVLQRVAAVTPDPLARFCAFFHDLGKLATDPALYPKHHGHDRTGFSMAVEFCNRLRLSTAHRTALAWISTLHGKANLWESLRDTTKLTMAEQALKNGIVAILPLIAAADKEGNPPITRWNEAVNIAGLSSRQLGIDQARLEGMPTGKRPALILQKRVELFRTIMI